MSTQRLIVHVSDAKVSSNPADVLITYSLGSCIGICLYDPTVQVGGMLHYQLPESRIDVEKAKANPFMFADTGMDLLIRKLISMGATTKRMEVRLAGGATMSGSPQGFQIGKRNHLAIRKIIWQHRLFIKGEDVGGGSARNLYLNLSDGQVVVKSNGRERVL